MAFLLTFRLLYAIIISIVYAVYTYFPKNRNKGETNDIIGCRYTKGMF